MSRNILKSNNSIVIVGQRPAFTGGNRTGSTMSGAYMSAVQGVAVGFSQQRQKSKQLGSMIKLEPASQLFSMVMITKIKTSI